MNRRTDGIPLLTGVGIVAVAPSPSGVFVGTLVGAASALIVGMVERRGVRHGDGSAEIPSR